jgi:hypothetical protein
MPREPNGGHLIISELPSITPRDGVPQTAAAIAELLYFNPSLRGYCLAAIRKLAYKLVASTVEEVLALSSDPEFIAEAADLLAEWRCAGCASAIREAMDNVATFGGLPFWRTLAALHRLEGAECAEFLAHRLGEATEEEQGFFLGNARSWIRDPALVAAVRQIASTTENASLKLSALACLEEAEKGGN